MAKTMLQSKQRGGRSISITFPQDLFDRLNEDAAKRGISFSRMVNKACGAYYGRKISYEFTGTPPEGSST